MIPVETLTAAAFAPFGKVVARPTAPPDSIGDPWRWWAQTALLEGGGPPYAVGYLELEPGPRTFDWAERHDRSEEMVVPVRGELLLYVAAAEPEPAAFRVFRVRPGEAVVLSEGVWHGAPLAGDGPATALVLLRERTGELDTETVKFDAIAVEEGS